MRDDARVGARRALLRLGGRALAGVGLGRVLAARRGDGRHDLLELPRQALELPVLDAAGGGVVLADAVEAQREAAGGVRVHHSVVVHARGDVGRREDAHAVVRGARHGQRASNVDRTTKLEW